MGRPLREVQVTSMAVAAVLLAGSLPSLFLLSVLFDNVCLSHLPSMSYPGCSLHHLITTH